MQNKDLSPLHYWQKKYLKESLCVLLLLGLATIAAISIFDYWGFQLFLIIGAISIAYLMIKSLREDLQTRAEAMIWEKNSSMFGNVIFDVGSGENTAILLNQNVVSGHQARECYNVMQTPHYMWEEDIFYTEQHLKWFSLRNTAFNGVILSLNAPHAPQNASAIISLSASKLSIKGNLKDYFTHHKINTLLQDILKLLHAKQIHAVTSNHKIYFWIVNSRKLFHQFSLIKPITPLPFIGRIQQLQQITENLLKALKN